MQHLDTHTLWIQQAVRTGRVDLRKVLGEENPADLLTKHSLSRERLEKLVALHGCKYLVGRAGVSTEGARGRVDEDHNGIRRRGPDRRNRRGPSQAR